jgi:hypothetical protein
MTVFGDKAVWPRGSSGVAHGSPRRPLAPCAVAAGSHRVSEVTG